MDQAGFHFFEAVGLLPDRLDLLDTDMSALQQSNRVMHVFPFSVGTLRFWMVLTH